MDIIKEILDEARTALLDSSLRNPLINYKMLKARGVAIVEESPPDVFQILVKDKKKMYFVPASEEAEADPLLFEDEIAEPDPDKLTDTKLQTSHPSTELQKRLLNTYYTARTAIEEQGVTTLYLTLGMLEWSEADSSDTPIRSPLILVPVTLGRSSVRGRFRVEYTEEEIGTNLSLAEKLKNDFGIHLPPLLEPNGTTEDIDSDKIRAYYEKVSDTIQSYERWRVDDTAIALGFFSFNKFLMYRDLDPNTWPGDLLTEHPVLQAILIKDSGFREPKSTIADDVHNIDEHLKPDQTHHVLDADSSQSLAIHDVSQGRNLVIQGPPGTGKSQTITNIIADAIARGKRVLFVAEKMAALEVVKRKLDEIALGNACLELHSHKMNKKAVIAELERTHKADKPTLADKPAEHKRLINTRDELNRYCDAVYTSIGDNKDDTVTPYTAFGEQLAAKRRLADIDIGSLNLDFQQFNYSESEFKKIVDTTDELQVLLREIGIPNKNRFWGSRCQLVLLGQKEKLERLARDARESVTALQKSATKLAQHLKFRLPETDDAITEMLGAAQHALAAPDLAGTSVQATAWMTEHADLEAGSDAGKKLNAIHNQYDSVLIREAWDQDVLEMRQHLAAHGDKWHRVFIGKYRAARSSLKGLCSQSLPESHSEQLKIVDAILEGQRERPTLEKIEMLGQKLFRTHWNGHATEWHKFDDILRYLSAFHTSVENGNLPNALIAYLSDSPNRDTLQTLIERVERDLKTHKHRLAEIIEMLELDEAVHFGNTGTLEIFPFTKQIEILARWEQDSGKLQDIAKYNSSAAPLRHPRFNEILKIANTQPEAAQHLSDIVRYAWYTAQINTALQERPLLAGFIGSIHQHKIGTFRKQDLSSLEKNRATVAHRHRDTIPKHNVASGQMGVLKREFAKKARHLPIRRLITDAREAVQTLKPVFMMSPLSVAKFLPPNTLTFDLVVFDEASQVKPVDAFGALIRGKQAVVVGDDKQLPPTDFFTKLAKDEESEDDENSDAVKDVERILGLFNAKSAPDRMLRWHYRSRHESLIAVSNFLFYDNKLQLFPSPDASREKIGLIYHHLPDTVYDRGKSRTNQAEAQIVAEHIMEHARTSPGLTLGVATFSTAQTQAIQDKLEVMRRKDPSYEDTFFNQHPEEPFFVKNLENVQGDERDVILISIGYGKDKHGKVAMNFGPLNNTGGERRLNVLITRARQRCEVFTNLTAGDIDLSRTESEGVAALKTYLHYAETRKLVDYRKGKKSVLPPKPPDSPFEIEVAHALRKRGYTVDHQIGSAGYFIDLGIKDPDRPGRYLLGIECDGATYHSAQSARDRDRLRQSVLEGLGWQIHRIWSTDWFMNPDRECQKAVTAIEKARNTPPPEPTPKKMNKKSDENAAETEETEKPIPRKPKANSATVPYRTADLKIYPHTGEFIKIPSAKIAIWVQEVVTVESPVHLEEVLTRITRAAGIKKGVRVRAAIETAAKRTTRSGKIERRGSFLYWTAQEKVPLRDRSTLQPASRKVEFIAPEELHAAIKQIVSGAIGISRDELIRDTCKLFGFKQVGKTMRVPVDAAIDALLRSGDITEKAGEIRLKR